MSDFAIPLGSGGDDGWWFQGQEPNVTSAADTPLGVYAGSLIHCFYRFASPAALAAGSAVGSAKIRFKSVYKRDPGTVTVKIYVVAAKNPAAPTSLAQLNALSLSAVAVDWVVATDPLDPGTVFDSPDLSGLVLAQMARDDWEPGDYLLFVFKTQTTSGSNVRFGVATYEAGVLADAPSLLLAGVFPAVSSLSGVGTMLTPSVPIAQVPAMAGASSVHAPSPVAGAIVPAMAGIGHFPDPGAVKGVTIPAMAGAGGLPAPSARWSVPDDQLPTCQVIYTLTLTGAADGLDDIVIPMASFQSRLSADAIHYLSASIPNSRAWAGAIASRRQGQWVVKKGLLRSEYALRQAMLRHETAAEAEAAAFKGSTIGGWLMAMAASAGLTTAGLLEQYTVPAYWPGADRIVPAMKHILDGDPTNAAFVQWFVENGYAGSTDFDWREGLRLLQTPAWLSAATGGYYTSWRQLCGLDGGHAYVSSSVLDLTNAKNARQTELSALQADPTDWSAGGTVLAEIIRVDYQSLSWARGSEGDSATITGQSTVSVGASKSVAISGVQYEALDTSGKRRLRCEVSLWLAPGDVATWGDESMVVGEVQHIVSVGEAYMEITEA